MQNVEEYKRKLAELERQNQELERQKIVLEEQNRQYQEKITQAFNTTDVHKLKEIAEQYEKDITLLEEQLNGII
jgi:exonuclease VII small subunit